MDDGKKKKRQKKKKKPGKMAESVSGGVEPPSANNTHVSGIEQNQNSKTADGQNEGLQKSDTDPDIQLASATEIAFVEGKIKESQEELDVRVQKETDPETNDSQSYNDGNSWHHKEAELETRILHLQTEQESWLQKETGYEEKINQLVDETAALRSLGVSLEERLAWMEEEKVIWLEKEKKAAEIIASLNKDNAKLRAQVIELEASRNDISHENQQLKENVSDLQSNIKNLENSLAALPSSGMTKHVAENEDTNSQLEDARALVEKLVSENEKLVEKVNNLNAELEQKSVKTNSSLPVESDDPMVKSSESPKPDLITEIEKSAGGSDQMVERSDSFEYVSDKIMESLKDDHMNAISRVSMESGEIVQIPLDENEVGAEIVAEPTTSHVQEKEDVPLMDAPLIGAPFRLISFVARYVSGADLVDNR